MFRRVLRGIGVVANLDVEDGRAVGFANVVDCSEAEAVEDAVDEVGDPGGADGGDAGSVVDEGLGVGVVASVDVEFVAEDVDKGGREVPGYLDGVEFA